MEKGSKVKNMLKRGLKNIMVLSCPYCSLNKAKSFSSYQHLLMALYPWLSLVWLRHYCCYFLNEHQGVWQCVIHTCCSSFDLCRIFVRKTKGKSNSPGCKFSKSTLGFSEGWLRAVVSSSKAVFLYSFTEKSSRNDIISKEEVQPTADNFVRGLLWFLHANLNPKFPTTAEGGEIQGTEAQESFRHLYFDKRIFHCSGIVL